jgi:hypothetical protein
MNGGSKSDYMNLNQDEVQLIYTTFTSLQSAQVKNIADVIATIFGGGK